MARWDRDTPDRPASKDLRHLRQAWTLIRPYRGRAVLAGIALLLAAGSTLGIGQGLRLLVDRGFLSGTPAALKIGRAHV